MSERYSEQLMDHFLEPRNQGRLPDATGTGVMGIPGQGPYLVFQIRREGPIVVAAAFQCHPCGVTIACGSRLTELVFGRSVEECRQITSEVLSQELGCLPVDKSHVAEFALSAMQMALEGTDP